MSNPWQQQQQPPSGHSPHPVGTNPSAPPGMPAMYGMPPPGYPPQGAPPPGYPGYYAPPSYPYPMPQHMAAPVPVPMPAVPVAPTPELGPRDQLRLQIENSLGTARLTTVFIGNLADGVTDEMLSNLFGICGHVKKWKRALDATGQPKFFGFLEFTLAEGVIRVMKFLKDCPIFGKALNIKADDPTKDYLAKYQEALLAHDAAHPDSPRLSFTMEDDLKALEEINHVFKEKNLTTSMQFIEEKVREITVGPTEKPKIVLEHPKAPEAPKRRDSVEEKKPKKPSLTGWETSGYREREKRWETREVTVSKSREQNLQRETERIEREIQDRAKLVDWLDSFDDSSFFLLAMDRLALVEDKSIERRLASSNAPSFYLDRDRWRERRRRDLQRQIDLDERDERRDVEMGFGQEDVSLGKRAPASALQKTSKRNRPPLVSISYTYEELLDAGHDAETAMTKLAALKKEKIKKLIGKIPTDTEDLFDWDIDWDLVELSKVSGWIQKAVDKWEAVREKAILAKDLEAWIATKTPPAEILKQLEGLPEAELFLVRLWRYLIYETEATAYGLQ